ncbi:hypothetical protein B0H16DRAFT_1573479 [Mycena metata]|uniref:Uncharacterized protein n=1 Tax=Mycena metata TaxID=1033252 RepID=A0AAD7MXK1_9AGAR|nr:hypothetical protein B0H16DRAFT_1573479 [Mycena metata]
MRGGQGRRAAYPESPHVHRVLRCEPATRRPRQAIGCQRDPESIAYAHICLRLRLRRARVWGVLLLVKYSAVGGIRGGILRRENRAEASISASRIWSGSLSVATAVFASLPDSILWIEQAEA